MRTPLVLAALCAAVMAQVPSSQPSATRAASRVGQLAIEAPSRIFVNSLEVRIARPAPDLVVRHTLDGTEPGPTSPEAPPVSILRATTTVRARSFEGDRPVGQTVSATFTKVEARPGLDAANLELGLRYTLRRGEFTRIPAFEASREDAWRPCARIEVIGALREDHVAARFVGFLRIDEPAVYELVLTSKDGSRFALGGKVLLEIDGVHEPRSVRAEVALGEGVHLIQLDWFHTTGEPVLDLAFAKAGQPVVSVPVTALARGKRE